jgi:hypothetical protein
MPGLLDNTTELLSRTDAMLSDLYHGPQRFSLPALGLSVYVPFGWIAGIDQGELYGIEPDGKNHPAGNDCRIYVTSMAGSFSAILEMMTKTIDLEYLKLVPASSLVVELKLASARFSVIDHALFKNAWVSAVSVTDNFNILFVALDHSPVSSELKSVTHALAGSVKLLNNPVIPFTGRTQAKKPVSAPA